MSSKNMWCALVLMLLITAVPALRADEKTATTAPSVKKGDLPPGNARTLSIPQAQAMLKEAIKKRYVGTMKTCQRVLMVKGCFTYVLSEAANIRIRASGFELAAPYTSHVTAGGPPSQDAGKVFVLFKKEDTKKADAGGKADANEAAKKDAAGKTITPEDYVQAYRLGMADPKGGLVAGKYTYSPNRLYNVGYLPSPAHSSMDVTVFLWADETAAQNFADAFNRLLYAAYQDEEFSAFSTAAKAWRENPIKPPLGPEAERERILAENAIKEKNLDSAVEHYESALEVQPMWPAGWFNLALIYAEQNNYADATDRMRHYLALVPDAPDAKDAREQMVIWEDKAKH